MPFPPSTEEEDRLRCVPSIGCWQGATNEAVLRSLEPWREARVLRLSDAKGAFSGWESHHLQVRTHALGMIDGRGSRWMVPLELGDRHRSLADASRPALFEHRAADVHPCRCRPVGRRGSFRR